jgi:hypothetical protein
MRNRRLAPRQSTRHSGKSCVVSCVATARSLPVSGVLASCRSGTAEGGTADNPREYCPSVLFGLLRCRCILDGVENSQRGICSFATNSLGYLPDWEAGSLQVSFRRAISCATLLRWGAMRAKFLYPNRFRGLVLMEECSRQVGSPLCRPRSLCRVGVLF